MVEVVALEEVEVAEEVPLSAATEVQVRQEGMEALVDILSSILKQVRNRQS